MKYDYFICNSKIDNIIFYSSAQATVISGFTRDSASIQVQQVELAGWKA